MKALKFTLLSVVLLYIGGCTDAPEVETKDETNPTVVEEGSFVHTPSEFDAAIKVAKPGDEIVLVNGIWRDFEISFEAIGTPEAPITIRAQDSGKVILSGQSNLRFAGEHLIIKGLVFKDGYTPTNEVISFRISDEKLANNSRVTEVVIDNYNNPERYDVDFWVMMYGKNNRFDHNHLIGKKNKGVTMAVRLNSEASQENGHRIDHNYFGPRPVLGSNGGETLRIGTSHYSLTNSNTIVENNYFDRCDGELEIISIKSGGNIVRRNTFYHSKGTLTMRHGNNNQITENVFFGGGVDHSGGIRVINKYQSIENNYMEGLTGYRFAGALVVMNGVPNSPINRYHQVDGASISQNTIVNSDHIQLAAGSDLERSAVPINSNFERNLIFHENGQDVFTVYDDVSGIKFADNVMHQVPSAEIEQGMAQKDFQMKRAENGLLYPTDLELAEVGVSRDITVTKIEDTGVAWYPKESLSVAFNSGKAQKVEVGEGTLALALASSEPGDVLELSSGTYIVNKILPVTHPISIVGSSSGDKPSIKFTRTSLFEIRDGGSLKLDNLAISGEASPDNVGNALIRTSKYSMLNNYRLQLLNSDITNLDINRAFNFLEVAKSTMADEIVIINSTFTDVTGAILKLNKEVDDFGIFNADYVIIQNSKFENVGEEVVNLYRGGRDESTFGPHLELTGTEISNGSLGRRNKSGASIMLHGVQVANIYDNKIVNSAGVKVEHTVSEPITRVTNNKFYNTADVTVVELVSDKQNTAFIRDNVVSEGDSQ